jgi:hypothetical protein
MGKRVYIGLAVVALALIGVIVWRVTQPPDEPVYRGKPLSEWLDTINVSDVQAANDAVRQADTNAIPALLRMLKAKDSPLKVNLMRLVQSQHIFKVHYTPAKVWNSAGCWGFAILGKKGQRAVPQLIEIVHQKISPDSQSSAIYALDVVGPSAKEVVPSLLRWATNANEGVRFSAIRFLRRIDPEAAAKAGVK